MVTILAGFSLLALLGCSDKDPAGGGTGDGDGGGVDGGTDGGGSDGGGTDGGGVDGGGSDGGTDGGGDTGDGGGDGGSDGGGTGSLAPAVILFIGDGMGFEHVRGGGLYAHGTDGSLRMETMPVQGRIQTASLSGLTDSAAAATTMSTGVKTWNSVLGLDGSLDPLAGLVDQARGLGMATGVVTSDRLTGATPAGFLVHVESRRDTDEIAAGLVAAPPDLLLGGGADDLEPLFAKTGVQLVTDLSGLAAADPTDLPLVGLFADAELPYVADAPDSTGTLATLATAALAVLDTDPEGFLLVVEGARIDHASHAQDEMHSLPEVAELDQAVGAALDWAATQGERPVTVLVTADHECGGLALLDEGEGAGTIPTAAWVWGDHTNADVPVFAQGPHTELLDDTRLHNAWVHAVLDAAVRQADLVVAPTLPRLADGDSTDLGAVVARQVHESSFGAGYNQLDALRMTADEDGLWIGVDGVIDGGGNGVYVLLDLDFGEQTGLGRDGVVLTDAEGELDLALAALQVGPGLDGLGFDAAVATLSAAYIHLGDLEDNGGLRGFVEPWGDPGDLWWLRASVNYDSGNLALHGESAPDAGAVGLTEGGVEIQVPWWDLYPDGLPDEGQEVAVAVLIASEDGTFLSNQVLPPQEDATAAEEGSLLIEAVVVLEIDEDGVAVGEAGVVE